MNAKLIRGIILLKSGCINYDKADDISDMMKYEDHFINNSTLIAISKSGRTLDSEDVQNF